MFDLTDFAPERDDTLAAAEPQLAMPPASARPVDPNGWDVVSAVRIDDINAAIAAAGTSPTEFSADIAEGSATSGKFGAWSIAPGGNGLLINLRVPLRDVTVERNGKTATLDEAEAVVRVELEYIPGGDRKMLGASGKEEEVETHLLVLRTAPDPLRLMEGLFGAPEAGKVATVLSVDRGREMGSRLYSVLKVGLDQWFNDNLAAFQHVFATVNVVKAVHEETEGGFDWMKPSAVSYAFGHNAADPDQSILAILCQTGGRKADGLFAQAQADMIPEGANAALCISRPRLVHDMIGKALPLAFDGLSEKDLTFSAKDTQVSVDKVVQLENVKDEDGREYSPRMEKLKILAGETEVRVESQTRTEITKGVWSIINTVDKFRYGLGTNNKGQKTLRFERTFHDDKHQREDDPTATIWEWVARGFALLGTILLGFLTGGAFFIVAAITAVISIGVITREGIKLVKGNDGPGIDLMLTAATQTVTWSTATRFDPVFAALNGGLQIGGLIGGGGGRMMAADTVDAQKQFQAPFADLMAARAKAAAS
jgi:hypothetical protein